MELFRCCDLVKEMPEIVEQSNAQNYHCLSGEQSEFNFAFSSFPICQVSTDVKGHIFNSNFLLLHSSVIPLQI